MRTWNPPVELSSKERFIAKRCAKRRVFIFLRELRHRLLDATMQQKLAAMYSPVERGRERVPPAQLALASLLQAALGVPDHEAVELTVVDMRWQMVLDCVGAEEPLFSQGTLFNFRQRVIDHGVDVDLFERSVELARETGGFSATHLRAAFDASPLWGAGRVEDTFNLIGRAAMHVVRTAAERLGKPFAEVARDAGIPVVAATSIKTGLDLDWDDPNARKLGLEKLLSQIRALASWLEKEMRDALHEPPLDEQWKLIQKLIDQDTEPDPGGGGRRVTQGVAKDRRISVSDGDMRHGRKTKRKRIDGYKRHLAVDVDSPGIICAVALTPANQSERVASEALFDGIERQGFTVTSLYTDRGYLGDATIEARRQEGMAMHCKPFPLRNGDYFHKGHFTLDLARNTVCCPNDIVVAANPGTTARFPASQCDRCPIRAQCTRARLGRGRNLSIHPHEAFHSELREKAKSPEGRVELRRRIAVEHSLATVHNRQGDRARFWGLRKNLFDLRRHAALTNLSVVDQLQRAA